MLARLADPRDFGELAAGSVVVGAGLIASESGLLAAIVQRRDRVEEAASTAFVASVASGVLFALAALALAPLVGAFFHSRTVGLVAAAMSGYLLLRQLAVVPDALLQRRFSYVRRVVLEPFGALASAGAAIGGTAAGLGVWGLLLGVYADGAIQAVLAWAFLRWRPQLGDVSFGLWRELARFGRHVVVSEGVRRGNLEGRTAIVGRLLGTAPLGQYGLALRVGTQPLAVLVNGFSYVLMPALARIADDPDRFRAAVVRGLRWAVALAFPGAVLLLVLGEPAVVLLFGEKWRPAGLALEGMALYSVGGAVVSVGSETWKAAGRPQWLGRVQTLGAVATVALTAALSFPFGLVGAGAGLAIGSTLAGAYALVGIARVAGASARELAAELWPPALAAALAGAAAYAVRAASHPAAHGHLVGIGLLVAASLAALVVYAVVFLAIRRDRLADAVLALRAARGAPAAEPAA